MQRFDNRSLAVISEANAIGTVMLRVQLLPAEFRAPADSLLQEYLDTRISLSAIDLTETEQRQRFDTEVGRLQNAIWSLAVRNDNPLRLPPESVKTGRGL